MGLERSMLPETRCAFSGNLAFRVRCGSGDAASRLQLVSPVLSNKFERTDDQRFPPLDHGGVASAFFIFYVEDVAFDII